MLVYICMYLDVLIYVYVQTGVLVYMIQYVHVMYRLARNYNAVGDSTVSLLLILSTNE